MIRFCERTGTLSATDLGRTASHYYIKHDTVEVSVCTMLIASFNSDGFVVGFTHCCNIRQYWNKFNIFLNICSEGVS